MSRTRGRPPLPESERRTYRVEVRLSAAERERLDAAADAEGVTLSEYLRTAAWALAMEPQGER